MNDFNFFFVKTFVNSGGKSISTSVQNENRDIILYMYMWVKNL